MINNKVIILGTNHHNTLGVVRSLGEKGIKPYVILSGDTSSKSFVLKSKYVHFGIILSSHDECLEYIIKRFSEEELKPIVICTSDIGASCVDLNYERLRHRFFVPNAGSQGNLTYLMDKQVMKEVACDAGLDVPTTWMIKSKEEIDVVEYPCIIKPLSSLKGSKSDIEICNHKDELTTYLKDRARVDNIEIQRFIERDFEYQLIGCSLNGGDDVIIPGYTNIIRSAKTTNTGFLEYLPINMLEYDRQKCIDFIKECNYSGLFSLEFIRGKDGKDYFLEINFRNDGNAYSVTAAGVNLHYIWVSSFLGDDYKDEAIKEIEYTVIMPELVDFAHVLFGDVSLIEWIKDVRRTDNFLYFDRKDNRPFRHEIQNKIKRTISLVLKR